MGKDKFEFARIASSEEVAQPLLMCFAIGILRPVDPMLEQLPTHQALSFGFWVGFQGGGFFGSTAGSDVAPSNARRPGRRGISP